MEDGRWKMENATKSMISAIKKAVTEKLALKKAFKPNILPPSSIPSPREKI
jgi:hypothetical protein